MCAIALMSAGGAIAAPIIQMAVGSYPRSGGISNIVINAVFAFVKCVSAIARLMRAAAHISRLPKGFET